MPVNVPLDQLARRRVNEAKETIVDTTPDFLEIWGSVLALRTAVAAGYVKPGRDEQATLALAAEIDRLQQELGECRVGHESGTRAVAENIRMHAELNVLDNALRCEGWPLEARISRAAKLAELAMGMTPYVSDSVARPAFHRGDLVRKRSGAQWRGCIVGEYSTALTPVGYAVESDAHAGSVQIYPAAAIELSGA